MEEEASDIKRRCLANFRGGSGRYKLCKQQRRRKRKGRNTGVGGWGWGKPSLGIPTRKSQRYNVLPFLSTQKTTYFLCLETIFLLWKSRAFLTKTFEKVSHEPCVLSMNLVGKELSLSYFSSPFSVFPPFFLSFLPQRLVGVPPSLLPPPKLRV